MTKRSLKGTNITTRAGLTRDGFASIWLSDTLPDSAKDNPLSLPVLQDVIAANIKAILDGGFITLSDSTNDVVAFAPSSVIDVSGSVYTVLEVFYIYVNGNIFKVNTGSATLTDTIRLIVSSTEDGLFQTADIDDGASVASFGGTTAGDGIVNYSNIFWLNDTFDINETGDVTMGGGDVSISNGTLTLKDGSNSAGNFTLGETGISSNDGSTFNVYGYDDGGSATGYFQIQATNEDSFDSYSPYIRFSRYNVMSTDAALVFPPTELTIASGQITVNRVFHTVDTESDASTDDLTTIQLASGSVDGRILILRAQSSSRTVVLKDSSGNLQLNGDFSLDNTHDIIMLIFTGGQWCEISRSNNSA